MNHRPRNSLATTAIAIAPGRNKTFRSTMTAPVAPGTYATDWRMVLEGVRWFGDTCTRQVEVT